VSPFVTRLIVGAGRAKDWRRLLLLWNTKLKEYVFAFHKRHWDAHVVVYDASALFDKVIEEPKKYGFEDPMAKCRRRECIWSDGFHITTAMHKVVAEDLAGFLSDRIKDSD
jgi:phospholipase/lecithinase/hemolysin